MDINLDDDLIEYLIFESGVLDKIGSSNHLMLQYSKIVDIVELQGNAPIETQKTDDLLGDDYSDDYGNDFEESDKGNKIKSNSQDLMQEDSEQEPQQPEPQMPTGEGEGLDDEIDDEQMISIAEN
mmetsp:Transcript_30237/g.26796  ORF Transcript_30237/g.26796 Transcript_30237/m.26796 type:complete len:125 (+) Transcript_30237:126-500(+)